MWKQGVMSAPNPNCPGCVALLAQIAALAAQVTQLQAQVTQLQARLNQNSRNSSRPPSTDGPQHRPPPPKPQPGGRPPGGQPGHPGHPRPLKPESEVDFLVPLVPVVCAHCQACLPLAPTPADPPPQRHQVIDLPPQLLETTEYQLHARTCAACGKRTWAALPPEAPTGVVGPRLQALCALLVGHYHLSRRDTQELLGDVLGGELSLGALSALEGRTAEVLAAPYAAVQAAVAADELFDHWHACRRGEIDRATFQQRLRPPQARLCRLLRRARDSGHWKGAGLARDLLRHWPSLWTFARVEGVEPTNNAAERAVRPGVLWRKGSFGNQGASGRTFAERLLTVAGSLRLQGRSVFAYLQAAVRAGRAGEAAPSLLPEETSPSLALPLAA